MAVVCRLSSRLLPTRTLVQVPRVSSYFEFSMLLAEGSGQVMKVLPKFT